MNLNTPSGVLLPGYPYYRDENNSLICSVQNCGESFGAMETLQYHISRYHTFVNDPNNIQFQHQAPTPTINTNVARPCPLSIAPAPSPVLQNTAGPPDKAHQSPYPSNGNSPPPTNGLMLPPQAVGSSVVSNNEAINSDWNQMTSWPEVSANLLHSLTRTHTLYANPQMDEEHAKLITIFDEFYDKTEFRNNKPPKHDERLWQLFRAKLDQIQIEMLQKGETYRAVDGTIKLKVLPPPKKIAIKPRSSLATPPATPVPGDDRYRDGVELWRSLDADAQTALFRHQLRTAKNRKALILEWNDFSAEIKKRREERHARDPTSKSAPSAVRESLEKTPPIVPTPTPTLAPMTINVKEIFENRLRELQAKRDIEEQERAQLQAQNEARQLKEEQERERIEKENREKREESERMQREALLLERERLERERRGLEAVQAQTEALLRKQHEERQAAHAQYEARMKKSREAGQVRNDVKWLKRKREEEEAAEVQNAVQKLKREEEARERAEAEAQRESKRLKREREIAQIRQDEAPLNKSREARESLQNEAFRSWRKDPA